MSTTTQAAQDDAFVEDCRNALDEMRQSMSSTREAVKALQAKWVT